MICYTGACKVINHTLLQRITSKHNNYYCDYFFCYVICSSYYFIPHYTKYIDPQAVNAEACKSNREREAMVEERANSGAVGVKGEKY